MTALAIEVEHGTSAAYRRCRDDDGRACEDCRAAVAAYEAERRRSPRSYVPAGKVRTHIDELRAGGMTLREISRQSKVSLETVRALIDGRYERCTVATKRAVLGVLPPRLANNKCVIRDDEAEPGPFYDDPLAALMLHLAHPDALNWKAEGECSHLAIPVQRRQEWFFPERGESTKPALAICARCPVWADCLGFALAQNMEGVWGRSCGNHRRKIVHHAITVAELADAGMADDPELSISEAIERVVASR